MMRKLYLFITILSGFCAVANAQAVRDSIFLNFRQSKVYLDTAYMNNARELQHARELTDYYLSQDSNLILTKVSVIGAASPEGSVKFNEWLSHQRAQRIFDYFKGRYEIPDSLTEFEFIGRDWKGLRQLVENDSNVPYRSDVLATLNQIIELTHDGELESQGNIAKIKRLHNEVPYLYMYNHLFPQLRASKIMLLFGQPQRRFYQPAEIEVNLQANAAEIDPVILQPKRQKPFYMALKTNLLFDALALPEIGAEFYLGKNFSIVGNWVYGWWDNDRTHHYWRAYGGDLALRRWFGSKANEKPLTGHHLGVYGGIITYDFEWGGRGYMGGLPGRTLWDRCNWYCGVEYGYSLPIARRINIDFTIGLGYLGGEYRVYDPIDGCYVWKETRKRNWFGPTKAEVSLVWLIGSGNYNKKGGTR